MKRNSLPWLVAVAALLVFAPLGLLKLRNRLVPSVPPVIGPYYPGEGGKVELRALPDFKMKDAWGNTVTWSNFAGGPVIVDFFFTRCASICPKMTSSLVRVQKTTSEQHLSVRLLSFSIDPESDSEEALRAYAARFGADPARWTFVRGSAAEVASLASTHFKVLVGSKDAESGQILHGPQFVLVDADRHIRGWYDGTDPDRVDALLADLKALSRAR